MHDQIEWTEIPLSVKNIDASFPIRDVMRRYSHNTHNNKHNILGLKNKEINRPRSRFVELVERRK